MKPQYIIIGGVNGAGKSTLYRTNPQIFGATRRLNADEKLRDAGGDWRNPADAARAMRDTVQDLRQALAAGESIHQETTLAGNAKSFQNLIDRAHAQGYEVALLYVTLNSADTAVDRVAARVAKGGHGVDEADIRRRYDSSHANLQVLASSVDTLRVFDNTRWYEPVYWRAGSKVLLDEPRYGLPPQLTVPSHPHDPAVRPTREGQERNIQCQIILTCPSATPNYSSRSPKSSAATSCSPSPHPGLRATTPPAKTSRYSSTTSSGESPRKNPTGRHWRRRSPTRR